MKFMLLASLIIFTACNGGSGSGNSEKKRDEARCLCMAQTFYSIESELTLPKNMKILMDNNPIFNSCGEIPGVAISKDDHLLRFSAPGVVPKSLNLKIVDMGEDCSNDALFFEQEDVPFSRHVTSDRPDKPRTEEITIKL